ncbi:hypothetical protein BHE74_00057832 [Ensete ventricosum]|nr:hypothetical protein BHE74_00057832 [Ensete ventricosum]
MHRARVRTIRLGTRQECVAEGIGSLPGWRKEVRQKKTETHRKIVGGWDSIEKIARNTLGDHQRKTVRLVAGEAGGCRFAGRVSRACQNRTREFAGRRLRLARRLSGVAERVVRSLTMTVKRSYRSGMDPGSSLGIELRIGRYDGSLSRVR